jgi:predicted RNase H-like HicB family nuclease
MNEMHKYEIIIYWSEQDNLYLAEVPELPGCMADGETPVDAAKNIEKIIGEWISVAKEIGRPVPLPKNKTRYA